MSILGFPLHFSNGFFKCLGSQVLWRHSGGGVCLTCLLPARLRRKACKQSEKWVTPWGRAARFSGFLQLWRKDTPRDLFSLICVSSAFRNSFMWRVSGECFVPVCLSCRVSVCSHRTVCNNHWFFWKKEILKWGWLTACCVSLQSLETLS